MNVDQTPVTPAFKRPANALIYCLVVGLLLLGPFITSMWSALTLDRLFPMIPSSAGDFTFLHKQIFEEKGDVDILFIGSSMAWADLNARVVQMRMEETLGGKRTVLTFGYNWPGEDAQYVLLRELLSRRRVRMVVLHLPHIDQFQFVQRWPHPRSQFWFQWKDKDVILGLNYSQIASYYAQSILGAPRMMLSGLRPDMTGQLENVADQNGSLLGTRGYNGAKFVRFSPSSVQFAPEESTYSLNPAAFSFSQEPLNDFQIHFSNKVISLLEDHNVLPVAISLPDRDHIRSETATERCNWTEVLNKPIDIIGVPPKKLFAGIDEHDADKLFWNPFHLNINGSEYFSNAISPALIKKYQQAVSR